MKEFYVVCIECGKEVKVEPPVGSSFFLVVCDNPNCEAKDVPYDKNEIREREARALA